MSWLKASYGVQYIAWLTFALAVGACGRLDPDVELAAAADRLAAGDYGEAAIRLSNVVQIEPDNAEARRMRGELALLLGEYRGAAEELGRAQTLGVPRSAIALELAEAWTATGEPDRALELLDSESEALDADPMYWILRAEALLGVGRPAEAERALDEGDRLGGGGSRLQIARARVAFARNDAPAAEALLAEALRAAPNDPNVLTAHAELLARMDRLDEAAANLLRAADLYRSTSMTRHETLALMSLAQIHLARSDLDAAESAAARLARLAPEAQLTAYLRGMVAFRRGNFDEAAELVQPLVSASPDTPQFRALLGAIHLARGNIGQAEQQFLTVLATSPRDPAAVKLLAETRLRQQRPEAALDTLRAVQDVAAEDPQIGLLSGLASLLAGNTEQGLLYLEQAASQDPTNELLRIQLARAYLAADRTADASALLSSSFQGGSAPLEAGLLRFFADVRLGSADAGTAAASELLAEFPEEPRALTAAAVYFQLQGENQRARALFEQAAGLETETVTARLFVAGALVQEGRIEDAEQLLARVVEEQPDNPQALTALAQLLIARSAFDEAAALLTRAAENTGAAAPRLALSQLRLRQGNLPEAQRQLDLAAQAAPENPEVVAVRGLLALAQGNAAEAATLLKQAAGQLPNRLGVSLALARAELASAQPDAARATLREVLALAPRSLPIRLALGGVELRLGNAAEALSLATDLKADFPAQSAGYLLDGDVRIAERRYTDAADSFGAAFDRQPTWPIMARRIEALQLAGRPSDALQACEDWVAANPQHAASALTLAVLLQGAGRSEEAMRAYDSILGSDPDNLVALNNAAWLSQELAEPRALELAERAYDLAADNPAVLDTLGWILLARGDDQAAVEHLTRAAELAPQAPEIRYHFAEALVASGRSAEAEAVLTALLGDERDFAQRDEAARLLETL